MQLLGVILSVLLGLVMLGSGVTKLARTAQAVAMMENVGVRRSLVPVLGAVQLAATFGLGVGGGARGAHSRRRLIHTALAGRSETLLTRCERFALN